MSIFNKTIILIAIGVFGIAQFSSIITQAQFVQQNNAYYADYDQAYFEKTFASNMVTLAMIGQGNCSIITKNCVFPVNNPGNKKLIIEIAAKYIVAGQFLAVSNACIYYPIRAELDCQFEIQTGTLTSLPPEGTIDLYYRDARYPVANALEKKGAAKFQLSLGNENGIDETKTEQNGVFNPSTFAVTGQKVIVDAFVDNNFYNLTDVFKLQLINKSNGKIINITPTNKMLITPTTKYVNVQSGFVAPEAGIYRKVVCKVVGANCEPIEMSNTMRFTLQVLAKKPSLLPLNPSFTPLPNNDRLNIILLCSEDHQNNSLEECRSKMVKYLAFDGLPYKLDKFGVETTDETKIGALAYGLFAVEPYKNNRSKFNFYYVNDIISQDELDDFDYLNGVEGGQVITNNTSKLMLISKSLLTPTANAQAVVPGFKFNNKKLAFKRLTTNPSFDIRLGSFSILHEFSHAFASLGDEYPGFAPAAQVLPEFTNYPNCAYTLEDAKNKWGDKEGLIDPFANEWLNNLNKYPAAKAVFAKARNLDLSNMNFIKVGYEKANGTANTGCLVEKTMIRPTKFSNMRGYLDGIEPFGSVNRGQIEASLNLFSSQVSTTCNNLRIFPECDKLPAFVYTCPSIVTNFKVFPSEYDTKTGYCKNVTTHPTLGLINIGNFPKSIIDECKRITPLANAKECTGTLDTDFYGTKVQLPYLSQAKLIAIKGKQIDKCLTSNKPLPPIGVLYKSGCFEETKNADGSITKSVYAVFNSNFVNDCAAKYIGTICYTGKLPLDKFISLVTKQSDKDAMIKYGVK
jgi:hypothetical protein